MISLEVQQYFSGSLKSAAKSLGGGMSLIYPFITAYSFCYLHLIWYLFFNTYEEKIVNSTWVE
jgi:hypothetical protein